MKKSIYGLCLLAVVLWTGAGVLAQGQGKGQGGGDKERVKERSPQAGKAAEAAPAAEATVEKNAGKGKAAKPADESATKQGKKGPGAAEVSGKGKGKGQEQQAKAFQKQQQHEQAKHLERVAKLNRLKELAVKKGDTEMVARVDKLIAKENEVYTRKQGKILGQPRAVPSVTGPNDVGARKGKAPEQKQKSGKQTDEGVKEQKKTETK